MSEDDLLTIEEVGRPTGAPAKLVLHTFGPRRNQAGGSYWRWIERYNVANLRWRRADIEASVDRQARLADS